MAGWVSSWWSSSGATGRDSKIDFVQEMLSALVPGISPAIRDKKLLAILDAFSSRNREMGEHNPGFAPTVEGIARIIFEKASLWRDPSLNNPGAGPRTVLTLLPILRRMQEYGNYLEKRSPAKTALEDLLDLFDNMFEELIASLPMGKAPGISTAPETFAHRGTRLAQELVKLRIEEGPEFVRRIQEGAQALDVPHMPWPAVIRDRNYFSLVWGMSLVQAVTSFLLLDELNPLRSSLVGAGATAFVLPDPATAPVMCTTSITDVWLQRNRVWSHDRDFTHHTSYLAACINVSMVCHARIPLGEFLTTTQGIVRIISDRARHTTEKRSEVLVNFLAHEHVQKLLANEQQLATSFFQGAFADMMLCGATSLPMLLPRLPMLAEHVTTAAAMSVLRDSSDGALEKTWQMVRSAAAAHDATGKLMNEVVARSLVSLSAGQLEKLQPSMLCGTRLNPLPTVVRTSELREAFLTWVRIVMLQLLRSPWNQVSEAAIKDMAAVLDASVPLLNTGDIAAILPLMLRVVEQTNRDNTTRKVAFRKIMSVLISSRVLSKAISDQLATDASHLGKLEGECKTLVRTSMPAKPAAWLSGSVAGLSEPVTSLQPLADDGTAAVNDPHPYAILSRSASAAACAALGNTSESIVSSLREALDAVKTKGVRELALAERHFFLRQLTALRAALVTVEHADDNEGFKNILAVPELLPSALEQLNASVVLPGAALDLLTEINAAITARVQAFANGETATREQLRRIQADQKASHASTKSVWGHLVAALSWFGGGEDAARTQLESKVATSLLQIEYEVSRNVELATSYRFLVAHALQAARQQDPTRQPALLDAMPLFQLRKFNDDREREFRLEAQTLQALCKLAVPGSLFDNRFKEEVLAARQVAAPEQPPNARLVEAATTATVKFLRGIVNADEMTVGQLVAQMGGGVLQDLLQRRGVAAIAAEFSRLDKFLSRDISSTAGRPNISADGIDRSKRLQNAVPLLQYRESASAMMGALRDLNAISTEALTADEATAFTELETDFQMSRASVLLDNVRTAVGNLPPSACSALAQLRHASLVLAFFKRTSDTFHDVITRAYARAATDEHALAVLQQLTVVRDLTQPFLNGPVPFAEIRQAAARILRAHVNAASQAPAPTAPRASASTALNDVDADALNKAGEVLRNIITNVVTNWDFVSLFFAEGATDATAAADIIQRVRQFMATGQYLQHPTEPNQAVSILFRYTSSVRVQTSPTAASEESASVHVLNDDLLLETVRFAVLSVAAAPDEETRSDLEAFKHSYDFAIRIAKVRQALQAAGHPNHQQPQADMLPVQLSAYLRGNTGTTDRGGTRNASTSVDPYANCAAIASDCLPSTLQTRLRELQELQTAWAAVMKAALTKEPRLRLLGPAGRLTALQVTSTWLQLRHAKGAVVTSSSLAEGLQTAMIHAFHEKVSCRTSVNAAVVKACSSVAAKMTDADLATDSSTAALTLLSDIIVQVAQVLRCPFGPRVGDLKGIVQVVDASKEAAGASRSYDAVLACLAIDCPEGFAPTQVLWCTASTTEADVDEWVEMTLIQELVPAAAAMNVDAMTPASRQRLARAYIRTRGAAGCSVYLGFGAAVGKEAFNVYSTLQPLPSKVNAAGRLCAMTALANLDGTMAFPGSDIRAISTVTIVAGGSRSGKSHLVANTLDARGAVTLRLAVHEGFCGQRAIKNYRELVDTLQVDAGKQHRPVGIHIDVFDVAGALQGLSSFLHNLLTSGMLVDTTTGWSHPLNLNLEHHIYVELPALCALDKSMAGGVRSAWPADPDKVTPSQHPFLQQLPALAHASEASVTFASFPILVDNNAVVVAKYLELVGLPDNAPLPPESAFPDPVHQFPPVDGAAVRDTINAAIDKVHPPVPKHNGIRAAIIRFLALQVKHLRRMRLEVSRQQASIIPQFHEVRAWAEPASAKPALANSKHANYIPNFFRQMMRLLLVEAAQTTTITNVATGEANSTAVWLVCPPQVINHASILVRGSPATAATEAPVPEGCFTAESVISSIPSGSLERYFISASNNLGELRGQLASAFGMTYNTSRMGEAMQHAGFVLTANLADRLLHLHGRRCMLEPIILEGGTGVGKSYMLHLYAFLVNRDPNFVVDMREHIIVLLKQAALAHLAGRATAEGAVVEGAQAETVTWTALGDLPLSAIQTDIIQAVRAVVAVDPEPRATALAAALSVRCNQLFQRYPLLRDGMGEALTRLTQEWVRGISAEDMTKATDIATKAASNAPDDTVAFMSEQLLEDNGAGLAAGLDAAKHAFQAKLRTEQLAAEKAAADLAGSEAPTTSTATGAVPTGSWKPLRGMIELEPALTEALALRPQALFRRIVAHEGLTHRAWDEHIERIVADATRVGRLCAAATLIVFIDELNTAGSLGIVSEAVASHRHHGRLLPANVMFVGAINPRRASTEAKPATAAPAFNVGQFAQLPARGQANLHKQRYTPDDESTDYMDSVPFVVKPLPACLEPLVAHHADLVGVDEKRFLEECVNSSSISELQSSISDGYKTVVVDAIIAAQNAVRRYEVPRIHLSIRCLLRAVRLFAWLQRQRIPSRVDAASGLSVKGTEINPFLPEATKPEHMVGTSLVVAIALAYWCRLPSQAHVLAERATRDLRAAFAREMTVVSELIANKQLPVGATFNGIVADSFTHLWKHLLDVPAGTVGTTALKEAVYAIVVGVHTRTPILITGPPCSGKTLAFTIASQNLVGKSARGAVFKHLQHLLSEPFQCSEHTEAPEVIASYIRTVKRQKALDRTNPGEFAAVLSLDEAGLPAERRQALKGLHDPLEAREIGLVFLSNTTLDAAKTSRMMQVLQAQANEQDMTALTRGLLYAIEGNNASNVAPPGSPIDNKVVGLVAAFEQVQNKLADESWFDTRDHLYLCKQLAVAIAAHGEARVPGDFDADMLLEALRRNFQTLQSENFKILAGIFFEKTGFKLSTVPAPQPLQTLRRALSDTVDTRNPMCTHFRHTMLIDHSNAELSLDILRTQSAAQGIQMEVVSLSRFPEDLTPTKQTECLAQIRNAVEAGSTVVLVNTGPLHSALYSLLNRHYTPGTNESTGQTEAYVTMAIGNLARSVRVHPAARIILLMNAASLSATPLPLLSRFERYSVGVQEALEELIAGMVARPPQWLAAFRQSTQGLLLRGMADGVNKFIRFTGEEGFHGLLPEDTAKALVLTTLRHSDRMQLALPNPYRSVDVVDGMSEAKAIDHDGIDEQKREGESAPPCTTKLQLAVRQLNYVTMQQLTVPHMLRACDTLPRHYVREYVDSQMHFTAATFLAELAKGKRKRICGGPGMAAADLGYAMMHLDSRVVSINRIMLMCPTHAAMEVLNDAADAGTRMGYAREHCVAADTDALTVPALHTNSESLFMVLPVDSCSSGPGCRDRIDAFFAAIPSASATQDASQGHERGSMLLVTANMAVTYVEQVTFVRRYLDECVDRLLAASHGKGVPALHLVLLLHLSSEQLIFRPVYHAVACDWNAVYTDEWGTLPAAELPGKESQLSQPIALPWVRMLFGLVDNPAADSVRHHFRQHIRSAMWHAVSRVSFSSHGHNSLPSKLSASVHPYTRSVSQREAALWVHRMLLDRPYLVNAIVEAFGVIWVDVMERIAEVLKVSTSRASLLTAVENAQQWLLTEFMNIVVVKQLAGDWGLEALALLPTPASVEVPASGVEERKGDDSKADAADMDADTATAVQATSSLLRAALYGVAMDTRRRLESSEHVPTTALPLVRCRLSVVPRLPLSMDVTAVLQAFRSAVLASTKLRSPGTSLLSVQCEQWRSELARPEWEHVRDILTAVTTHLPFRSAFAHDFIRITLQQYACRDVDLNVYVAALLAKQRDLQSVGVTHLTRLPDASAEALSMGEEELSALDPATLILFEAEMREVASSIQLLLRPYATLAGLDNDTSPSLPDTMAWLRQMHEEFSLAPSVAEIRSVLNEELLRQLWAALATLRGNAVSPTYTMDDFVIANQVKPWIACMRDLVGRGTLIRLPPASEHGDCDRTAVMVAIFDLLANVSAPSTKHEASVARAILAHPVEYNALFGTNSFGPLHTALTIVADAQTRVMCIHGIRTDDDESLIDDFREVVLQMCRWALEIPVTSGWPPSRVVRLQSFVHALCTENLVSPAMVKDLPQYAVVAALPRTARVELLSALIRTIGVGLSSHEALPAASESSIICVAIEKELAYSWLPVNEAAAYMPPAWAAGLAALSGPDAHPRAGIPHVGPSDVGDVAQLLHDAVHAVLCRIDGEVDAGSWAAPLLSDVLGAVDTMHRVLDRANAGPRLRSVCKAVSDTRTLRAAGAMVSAVAANAPNAAAIPSEASVLFGGVPIADLVTTALQPHVTARGIYLLASLGAREIMKVLRSQGVFAMLGLGSLAPRLQEPAAGAPAPTIAAYAAELRRAAAEILCCRAAIFNAQMSAPPANLGTFTSAYLAAGGQLPATDDRVAGANTQNQLGTIGDGSKHAPWAVIAWRLLSTSGRAALQSLRHTRALLQMYSFAHRAFAFTFTEAGALSTPLARAIENLPIGEREEGRRRLDAFLAAWAELKRTLQYYHQCRRELAANEEIPTLVKAVSDPSAAVRVVTVADVTGLPSDMESSASPLIRMLAQRFVPDHNAVTECKYLVEMLDDEHWNVRQSLGDPRSKQSEATQLRLADIPWNDAASVENLLVTGDSGGEENILSELSASIRSHARWVPDPQPVVQAATPMQQAPENDELLAILKAAVAADLRILQAQRHQELATVCPNCHILEEYIGGCDYRRCGLNAHDDKVRAGHGCGTIYSMAACIIPMPSADGSLHPAIQKLLNDDDLRSLLPSDTSGAIRQVEPLRGGHWELDTRRITRLLVSRLVSGRPILASQAGDGPLLPPLDVVEEVTPEVKTPAGSQASNTGAEAIALDPLLRLNRAVTHLQSAMALTKLPAEKNETFDAVAIQQFKAAMRSAEVPDMESLLDDLTSVATSVTLSMAHERASTKRMARHQPSVVHNALAAESTAGTHPGNILLVDWVTTNCPPEGGWCILFMEWKGIIASSNLRIAHLPALCALAAELFRKRAFSQHPNLNEELPTKIADNVKARMPSQQVGDAATMESVLRTFVSRVEATASCLLTAEDKLLVANESTSLKDISGLSDFFRATAAANDVACMLNSPDVQARHYGSIMRLLHELLESAAKTLSILAHERATKIASGSARHEYTDAQAESYQEILVGVTLQQTAAAPLPEVSVPAEVETAPVPVPAPVSAAILPDNIGEIPPVPVHGATSVQENAGISSVAARRKRREADMKSAAVAALQGAQVADDTTGLAPQTLGLLVQRGLLVRSNDRAITAASWKALPRSCVVLSEAVKVALPPCVHSASGGKNAIALRQDFINFSRPATNPGELAGAVAATAPFILVGLPPDPSAPVEVVLISDWEAFLQSIDAYTESDNCETCGAVRPCLSRDWRSTVEAVASPPDGEARSEPPPLQTSAASVTVEGTLSPTSREVLPAAALLPSQAAPQAASGNRSDATATDWKTQLYNDLKTKAPTDVKASTYSEAEKLFAIEPSGIVAVLVQRGLVPLSSASKYAKVAKVNIEDVLKLPPKLQSVPLLAADLQCTEAELVQLLQHLSRPLDAVTAGCTSPFDTSPQNTSTAAATAEGSGASKSVLPVEAMPPIEIMPPFRLAKHNVILSADADAVREGYVSLAYLCTHPSSRPTPVPAGAEAPAFLPMEVTVLRRLAGVEHGIPALLSLGLLASDLPFVRRADVATACSTVLSGIRPLHKVWDADLSAAQEGELRAAGIVIFDFDGHPHVSHAQLDAVTLLAEAWAAGQDCLSDEQLSEALGAGNVATLTILRSILPMGTIPDVVTAAMCPAIVQAVFAALTCLSDALPVAPDAVELAKDVSEVSVDYSPVCLTSPFRVAEGMKVYLPHHQVGPVLAAFQG